MVRGRTLRNARRVRALLVLAGLIIVILYFLELLPNLTKRGFDIWSDDAYVQPLDQKVRSSQLTIPSNARCSKFPPGVFEKIQIIIKIGAPEVHTKLAAQLDSNAVCVDDLLIFSDYEEDIEQHHIYDALSNLRLSEWTGNVEYDIYKQIRSSKERKDKLNRSIQGWKLDKYKFLPMMDLVWELRPSKDWFIFVEADSYIFWDNLFRWLAHLDPEKDLYMGSPVWRVTPPGPPFAHGGSGIILSRAALKRLVRPRGYDCETAGCTQYGVDLRDECCGDAVLSDVFDTRGISLKGYWPMINGEKPSTVRYGRDEQWCEPVIIMHHINETDQAELWDWEMRRPSPTPVTFEDLWDWQEHLLSPNRKHWTVLPEGETLRVEDGHDSAFSANACLEACSKQTWCYQWQHTAGICELSKHISFGREQSPDGDGGVCVSGTMIERTAAFKQRMGHCKDAHWVRPNPQ